MIWETADVLSVDVFTQNYMVNYRNLLCSTAYVYLYVEFIHRLKDDHEQQIFIVVIYC